MRSPSQKITWVAVADGGKALLLVNTDTDATPVLRVMDAQALDNPPARDQGTDRPGRMPDQGAHRSAVETTDWHDIAEARFLKGFAERIDRAAQADRYDRMVLIAPPRVLGDLRAALSAPARRRIAAEIPHDLTHHRVDQIEARVAAALTGAA